MKHSLLTLILSVYPMTSLATECIPMSGLYRLSDNQGRVTSLTVNQQDCDRLYLDYDYNHQMRFSRTIILDGVNHVVFSSSEVISYESATPTPEGISYRGTDEYLREKKTYVTEGKIFLDSALNLIEETAVFDDQGTLLKSSTQKYERHQQL